VTFQKIFILGAGAVGSVIGGLLSQSKEVTLIGNKDHVDAMNSKGLLVSGDVSKAFSVSADTQIREIPRRTLIFLTSKAYDSEKAIRGIRDLVREDTVVLVLQNGLGNEESVRHVLGGGAKIMRGVTTIAAELFNPGEVKYWKGETTIEREAAAEKVADVLNASAIKTSLSNNMRDVIWAKVIVNSVVNPLTTVFQVRNCEIGAHVLASVRHDIVRECVQVAEAEGITLPSDMEKVVDKAIRGYTNFSSMYQDIVKRKRTEIDFLNGKIVELGQKHNVPTPTNEILVDFVKFLEDKNGVSRRN
jgi:2-dehydropantoate 2-reductase